MDTFKLKAGDAGEIHLTEDNYFQSTQRHELYCTTAHSGNALYLAVCPECDNPIEIRNLGPVLDVNRKDPRKPFGKHYIFTVPGLAVANHADYEDCSKRGHVTLGASGHRSNDNYNKAVLRILIEHAAVIRELLADCIGVTVGQKLFERLIDQFVGRSAYKCKGVQPSNLPFSIAYWAENQGIWGQIVKDSELQKTISESKLQCFRVNEKNQIATVDGVKGSPEIRFYFTSPRKGNEEEDEPNSMTLHVAYYTDKKPDGKDIYKKTITYKNSAFFDAIARENRSTSGSAIANRQRWTNVAKAIVEKHRPDWAS